MVSFPFDAFDERIRLLSQRNLLTFYLCTKCVNSGKTHTSKKILSRDISGTRKLPV